MNIYVVPIATFFLPGQGNRNFRSERSLPIVRSFFDATHHFLFSPSGTTVKLSAATRKEQVLPSAIKTRLQRLLFIKNFQHNLREKDSYTRGLRGASSSTRAESVETFREALVEITFGVEGRKQKIVCVINHRRGYKLFPSTVSEIGPFRGNFSIHASSCVFQMIYERNWVSVVPVVAATYGTF